MADYQYVGLTAYILENEENNEKLSVLAEAIDLIQSRIDTVAFDQARYQAIMETEAFQYLYDHDSVCYPHESELPENTPEGYDTVQVENVVIKDIPMIRLYVPAVAKDENKIHYFIYDALGPLIETLFRSDIVGIKTKESIEYEDFQDGKETVVLSPEKRKAVSA